MSGTGLPPNGGMFPGRPEYTPPPGYGERPARNTGPGAEHQAEAERSYEKALSTWLRRHKTLVGAVAVILLAILVAIIFA